MGGGGEESKQTHYPKLRLFSFKRQIIAIVDSVSWIMCFQNRPFRGQQGKF